MNKLNVIVLCAMLVVLSCARKQNDYVYNIADYGAKGDSLTLNTEAIQNAIDACFASGGGVVLIPPGKFTTGTLYLRSNIEYRFLPGAMLIGSANLKDYNAPEGEHNIMLIRQAKPRETLRVLLDGTDGQNIAITGKGTIEGNGNYFWDEDYTPRERPVPWISFRNAKNITIRDITLQNSPSHVLRFEDSDQLTLDGMTIINDPRSPNTDGIDLVDSRNVLISNCYVATGDDAICLKTDTGGIVENVVVTNCILQSDDAAIKFGTGSAGITRNCSFTNITIKNSRYGVSLFMLEGGVFESNSFSNFIIREGSRHKHEYPVFIDIDKKRPTDQYGLIRNITFSNFNINSGGKILINGRPERPLENLTLQQIHFTALAEQDFSNASKPRGNKNFPKLPESIDRAPVAAYLTIGYVTSLHISGSSVHKASPSRRKDIDLIGIGQLNLSGNSGADLSLLENPD